MSMMFFIGSFANYDGKTLQISFNLLVENTNPKHGMPLFLQEYEYIKFDIIST